MAGRFAVSTVFSAVDKMTAPLNRMQNSVRRMTSSANRRFGTLTNTVSKANKAMLGLAAGGLAAVGFSLGSITKDGMGFEQQFLQGIAKYSGAVKLHSKDYDKLEKTVLHYGATTTFTNTQAAETFTTLAAAGVDANKMYEVMGATIKFATAQTIEASDAAGILTANLGAWGLMTDNQIQLQKNSARITDVMSKAASSANMSVLDLQETMKDAAPVAHSYGASLEEANTFAVQLAKSGIRGSVAATPIKNFYQRLSAPTKQARDAIKSIRLEYRNAKGEFLPAYQILANIDKQTRGMSKVKKGGILKEIFGAEAVPGILAVLAQGPEAFRKMEEELLKSGGSTQTAFDMMLTTAKSKWDLFGSAVSGVSLDLYKMYEGPLKDTIDGMTTWVTQNQELIKTKVSGWIKDTITFFKKYKDVIIILGKVAVAVYALSTAMGVLNAVMAINPVLLIMTALITLGVVLWTYRDKIVQFFKDVWDGFKRMSGYIFLFMGPFGWLLGAVVKFVRMIWSHKDEIAGFFASAWDGAKEKAVDFAETVKEKLNPIFKKMFGIDLDEFGARLKTATGMIVDVTIKVFQQFYDTLVGKVTALADKIGGVFKGIAGWFGLDTGSDNGQQSGGQTSTGQAPLSPLVNLNTAALMGALNASVQNGQLTIHVTSDNGTSATVDNNSNAKVTSGVSTGKTGKF